MLLFLELVTVVFTLLAGLHAWWRRGSLGLWLFAALLLLGWLRESFVVLRDLLYGYAPLHLVLAGTPVVGAVIWAFSIYAALCWSEEAGGGAWGERLPSARTLLLVAGFMIALACFYEPFLALTGMARWQAGTRTTGGVPWIALVGYPTLAVAFLALFGAVVQRWRRPAPRLVALLLTLPPLALGHAWGLQQLKRLLGW